MSAPEPPSRTTRRPVLVVGVDGSDTSWRALHYALGLARAQHGSLVVVVGHTVTPGLWPASGAISVVSGADAPDNVASAVAKLAIEAGDVPTMLVRGTGDPVALLAKAARQHQADAIIVGSSNARRHRLFGSVGLRAVRLRRWPVTVVP